MSSNTEEVQKLLGEKKQLEKEEKILEKVIELIKRQMSALQIEQLEINSRLPVARYSPLEPVTTEAPVQQPQDFIPEINLDVLGSLTRGNIAVDQGEVEEEDDD